MYLFKRSAKRFLPSGKLEVRFQLRPFCLKFHVFHKLTLIYVFCVRVRACSFSSLTAAYLNDLELSVCPKQAVLVSAAVLVVLRDAWGVSPRQITLGRAELREEVAAETLTPAKTDTRERYTL